MSINFHKAFGIHEQTMLLRARRGEVLANNLANADTPRYKARDVDFRAILAGQAETSSWEGMMTTDARHLRAARGAPFGEALLYRVPTQPAIDGNTVDVQREQSAFLQNALGYQASLRFLDGRIKGLLGAIRGE